MAGGNDRTPDATDLDGVVVVGRVTAVYGIKGWVKIASFTDPPDNLLDYRPWLLQSGGDWEPVAVVGLRPHGKGYVAQLEGCSDRDEAQRFVRRDIGVPREVLPEPEADSHYWFDLVGLTVNTPDGVELGRVKEIMPTGANDVLVVEGEDRERLIPYVVDVIVDVDVEAGRMVADWDPEF